ncbi:MAG: FAD binding domain-containing protein [Planctomycetota bacterium]
MNRFAIARPRSYEDATTLLGDDRYSLPVLKAGGMDIVDHIKEGLMSPDLLVDVRRLGNRADGGISLEGGRIRIEASTVLADLANSTIIRENAPALAQSAASAATPQVRNVASVAGNLLQRPRCWYYRNETFHCLKKGGYMCYAVEGENEYHAIFGEGPCHIVHPSNIAPLLAIANGHVHLTGGERDRLPVAELFHMPDSGIRSEHELEAGEIVTHVTLDPAPTSGFYAVKAKQSFDWPLVFAVATLDLDGSTIRSAKVCAGAVAPVPWPLPKVAERLRGVSVDDEAGLTAACAGAADGARPMRDNAYKTKLLPVAVRRAVRIAAGRSEVTA